MSYRLLSVSFIAILIIGFGSLFSIPVMYAVIPLAVGYGIGRYGRGPRAKQTKWFTIARSYSDHHFTNTYQPYSVQYLFRISPTGERIVEISSPSHQRSSADRDAVLAWAKVREEYLLYIEPWESGLLSIDQVKSKMNDLQLVPHDGLAALEKIG